MLHPCTSLNTQDCWGVFFPQGVCGQLEKSAGGKKDAGWLNSPRESGPLRFPFPPVNSKKIGAICCTPSPNLRRLPISASRCQKRIFPFSFGPHVGSHFGSFCLSASRSTAELGSDKAVFHLTWKFWAIFDFLLKICAPPPWLTSDLYRSPSL